MTKPLLRCDPDESRVAGALSPQPSHDDCALLEDEEGSYGALPAVALPPLPWAPNPFHAIRTLLLETTLDLRRRWWR